MFETLEFSETTEIKEALSDALEAMASFGSKTEHMNTISRLLVQIHIENATAFRRLEKERAKEKSK